MTPLERVTSNGESDNPFADNKAIANFGVGKNMVASMQHQRQQAYFYNQKINKEPRKVLATHGLLRHF